MHRELYLARGVAKAIGDTNSAEQGLSAINLMDSGSGFALDPSNGWQPQIAGLKGGGVWADSQIETGRRLVAGADGNVNETIRLSITTGDALSLYRQVTRLNRFIMDCREMWTTFHQIEPVFLWWWAIGAPGRQYALIYNIDLAVTYPDVGQGATADVTITLEREPYWRALQPGTNPKQWTLRNTQFDVDDLSLTDEANHLVYTVALANRFEYESDYDILSRNYIDIAAEDVPGDAPALVEFTAEYENTSNGVVIQQAYVSRSTKPTSAYQSTTGATMPALSILPAPAATAGTDTTSVADTGGIYGLTGVAGGKLRRRISFATVATSTQRLQWDTSNGANGVLLRGKYSVFLRARQLNGAFGDISIALRFIFGTGGGTYTELTASPVVSGTSGNTSAWPLTYFGTVTIPLNTRNEITPLGYGITDNPQFQIALLASRASGASELYVCDLVLVPFDEPGILLTAPDGVIGTATGNGCWYDYSGYATHGDQSAFANSYVSQGTGGPRQNLPVEIRGQDLVLEPGVNNRLYFVFAGVLSSVSNLSDPNSDYALRLNIIPRWYGARDI
jgi:hypothetical protein